MNDSIFWEEICTDPDYIDCETKAIRRFIAAIIGRAILDYRSEFSSTLGGVGVKKSKQIRVEAEVWIFHEGDNPEVIHSFAWCCSSIDLDMKVLRTQIKDLVRYQGLKKHFYKLGNIRTFAQNKRMPKANF